MDIRRIILYAALALIAYTLWTDWQKEYPSVPTTSISNVVKTNEANEANAETNLLPTLPETENNQNKETNKNSENTVNALPVQQVEAEAQSQTKTNSLIRVKTDVLALNIDKRFGDILQAELTAYPLSVDEANKPVTLLFDNEEHRYIANSSLLVGSGSSIKNVDFNFSSEKQDYQLQEGQKQLSVTLSGKTSDGLKVKKIITLTRGSYLIHVDYQLENGGQNAWKGYMNTQLLQTNPQESSASLFQVGSYTGASYSNPGENRYKKVSFKDMTKSNLKADATGGWVAMQQHYFLSAWIPDKDSKNVFYTRANNDDYTIGMVSKPLEILPQKTATISSKLYIGPEVTSVLQTISPGLELTVDYGWLWFLSSLLFSLLKSIHSLVGNWGWSIVLVTVLVKLAFYRLSASSYKSMAGMRKLQPKLQALRERYGDDKAKISQATMELYRQEKVNPLGGCLPIIIQIPVFIALYWVLLESVELRQAPFIFWVKDLAASDPYHVLPIIMGITMLIQQRLNPAPPDPTQAKVMMFLPILFTALFWNFPAGLVLYWIVNNTLSILQQWYITKKYSDVPPAANKKANKKPLAIVK
jgi:YidC/Oxa1 family membrane protein insertase